MAKENKMNIGEKMLEIIGHDLEMKEVKLPDSASGHVTLVVLVSRQGAQSMVDSWITPFEKELCERMGYMYYEVPLISGMWGKFFSGVIDGGMRAGIPSEKHRNIVTFYGDYGKIYKKLNISDKGVAHPMLLDKEGIIRWRDSGFSTDKKIREMIEAARGLNMEK
ncbi:MAG: hypothetical protein JW825_03080 [Candidatus Methanofastidiosa archaeon]|nr:hypothetical protein [Candidatus Methanofastidiosa archaeon]